MQVLINGKEYLLDGSDRLGIEKPVHIKFCQKDGDGKFVNGMTSEEILQMLIHRQQHMVNKDGSAENVETLLHLKQAHDCMLNRNRVKLVKNRLGDSKRNDISVQAKSAEG